jgi:hypothetical protein
LETDDSRGKEEITKITKLVSNDNNNSFELPLYTIFLEIYIYDDINKTRKRKTGIRALQSGQDLPRNI